MALIKCPECGKEISDKANACIHCGYPLNEQKEEFYKKITSLLHEETLKYEFHKISFNVIKSME